MNNKKKAKRRCINLSCCLRSSRSSCDITKGQFLAFNIFKQWKGKQHFSFHGRRPAGWEVLFFKPFQEHKRNFLVRNSSDTWTTKHDAIMAESVKSHFYEKHQEAEIMEQQREAGLRSRRLCHIYIFFFSVTNDFFHLCSERSEKEEWEWKWRWCWWQMEKKVFQTVGGIRW